LIKKYSPVPSRIHPKIRLIRVIHAPDFGIEARRPVNVPTRMSRVPIPKAKTNIRLDASAGFCLVAA
jgi:hypothetical protein